MPRAKREVAMQCRITTLVENTAGIPRIIGEWGFSALVETDEMTVLMDSGEGHGIVHNADLLGIDLAQVDKIVISHSHVDHTGGLRKVLGKIGKQVEVVAARNLWEEKYRALQGGKHRYIGIPYARAELESLGARFTLTQEPIRLTDNMVTTGEVPIVTDFEKVGEDDLLTKVGDEYQLDSFPDDRSLIVKTHAGLAVILGCAHRCLINTLYHAQKLTGVKEIHTVVGGCHLIHASEERIEKTIAALKDLDVIRVGVSHCTGLRAGAMMAAALGDRFLFNMAGTSMTVP
jgi:7,8-dihydropterin-6-yl-methyl-4-(beta-D-ribofuranosyl)aminobenzene 5'-phosphate synthase